MKDLVNWNKVKRDIKNALKQYQPKNSRFVNSPYLAEYLVENQKDYKTFCGITLRCAKIRVTKVLREHLNWEVYSNNDGGSVYIMGAI